MHTTSKCSTQFFTSKQSSPGALYPAASKPARSRTEARNRSAPGRTAGKRLQRLRRVLPARVGIKKKHNPDWRQHGFATASSDVTYIDVVQYIFF